MQCLHESHVIAVDLWYQLDREFVWSIDDVQRLLEYIDNAFYRS